MNAGFCGERFWYVKYEDDECVFVVGSDLFEPQAEVVVSHPWPRVTFDRETGDIWLLPALMRNDILHIDAGGVVSEVPLQLTP